MFLKTLLLLGIGWFLYRLLAPPREKPTRKASMAERFKRKRPTVQTTKQCAFCGVYVTSEKPKKCGEDGCPW